MLVVLVMTCVSILPAAAVSEVAQSASAGVEVSCSRGLSDLDDFRCKDGRSCVAVERVCDGRADCEDASDEAFCQYPNIGAYFRSKVMKILDNTTVTECGREQSWCEGDTCVSLHSDCRCTLDCSTGAPLATKSRTRRNSEISASNVTSCILPEYPDQGTYKVLNVDDSRPGQAFESFVLTVSCRRGFGVVGSDSNENKMQIYCVSGNWLQSMPRCVRFCKLEEDASIRYMCHIEGVGFKACSGYVPPGTRVQPVCRTPLYYSTEELSYMQCISGFWDYVPHCRAECGRVTPEGDQLVIGGSAAKLGELPWHVGIYEVHNYHRQICGGSLVSNNVVISAAHCFWSDVKKQLPASDFAVGTGKIERSWKSDKDVVAQYSDVKDIRIPSRFKGASTNFQEDIAMLTLKTPVVYKTYLRPVCLNFDPNFERLQLLQGKLGKVAGWGLTKNRDGGSSSILKVVDLPYISIDTCIDTLPPSFTEYITGDKFCAGYLNGTALCQGDSGGGLAFADKELGINRYYLRGIVSTAPTADGKDCNDKTYTTFTTISKHEGFIKRWMTASVPKSCPSYSFQCAKGQCLELGVDCDGKNDCADGSDEDEQLCTPEPESTPAPKRECVLPPYPTHGAYRVSEDLFARPGQVLESPVLRVFCLRMIVTFIRTEVTRHIISCTDGEWSSEMPDCERANTDFQCTLSDGSRGECMPYYFCDIYDDEHYKENVTLVDESMRNNLVRCYLHYNINVFVGEINMDRKCLSQTLERKGACV